MRRLALFLFDKYMDDQQKVQKAWLDLLKAVNEGNIKDCVKYSMYLNYLVYKKPLIKA